jgi:hypothetical protein
MVLRAALAIVYVAVAEPTSGVTVKVARRLSKEELKPLEAELNEQVAAEEDNKPVNVGTGEL